VAEALNDLLQGNAITKEQSATTLQRCLKMLWTRLPSYTISRQALPGSITRTKVAAPDCVEGEQKGNRRLTAFQRGAAHPAKAQVRRTLESMILLCSIERRCAERELLGTSPEVNY
jgi:hypothetical protein